MDFDADHLEERTFTDLADCLAYALLDTLLDRYFQILEMAGEKVELLEDELIAPETVPFLHNLYGHVIQAAEEIDTYRDMLSGLQDLYLSSLSNRMNEVMKVLTVAATIFVPLTFITGVYGMNFRFMPELTWKWAYPLFWLMSLILTVVMVAFFRRKKYL